MTTNTPGSLRTLGTLRAADGKGGFVLRTASTPTWMTCGPP